MSDLFDSHVNVHFDIKKAYNILQFLFVVVNSFHDFNIRMGEITPVITLI